MDKIETTKNLDDATEQALSAAIEEFKKTGTY
jgi:F-type H+-transporting ATPase subunit alpha